ncbi:hypothetical protein D3C77_718180 [compost metagenome]
MNFCEQLSNIILVLAKRNINYFNTPCPITPLCFTPYFGYGDNRIITANTATNIDSNHITKQMIFKN